MMTKTVALKTLKKFGKDAGKTYRIFSKDLSKRFNKLQDKIPVNR